MQELLSGNEAIARGAYEAGVRVATAYPGTPSTEILETIAERFTVIDAQWSPNEKVALEVGLGAAIGGARTLVAMKHVGLNVAADPLFTAAYTGVNAGLVIVTAGDPGMHSSQNEQDNRWYGRFAKLPVLEPADSSEARDFVIRAFEISERFDIPVLLHSTTRVSHSKSLVELRDRVAVGLRKYRRRPQKYVMIPAYGRQAHERLEEKLDALARFAHGVDINRCEEGDGCLGIITSGVAYQYAREAAPGLKCLKLGLTNPLPAGLVADFAASVDRILVVEELEPFLEDQIRAMGLDVEIRGKDILPRTGELTVDQIAGAIAGLIGEGPASNKPETTSADAHNSVAGITDIPERPPVMCPGCPHRATFYVLKKLKLTVTGDIGCYTLGALPPLEAMDTCICMGASIGVGLGMGKADPDLARRTVAVIGDSTFLHSGLTGLLDLVYNGGHLVTLILDNGTTAMTGHQDHPGTGTTLRGDSKPGVDIAAMVRALGIKDVRVIDPFEMKKLESAITGALSQEGPAVFVIRRKCVLVDRESISSPVTVADACVNCGLCLELGCPALIPGEERVSVDKQLCVGCGLCAQLCQMRAIVVDGRGGDDNG